MNILNFVSFLLTQEYISVKYAMLNARFVFEYLLYMHFTKEVHKDIQPMP